eukprot:TRINITY_DN28725_c0_g1_i1.p1 TRINITY_DN28725_c0_g1~~TRINITY_DN28725_c0_g1_i1.p1  ORF type:complete len:614 (+),score=91.51 TRINITY_DN28725_c0_g1_i1:68-1909(+)
MFTQSPERVERKVTDVGCCVTFLIGVAGFTVILVYSFITGDPQRLLQLKDTSGQQCGVSPGVESTPYLFFCPDASGSFSQSVCVDACPGSAEPTQYCQYGYDSIATDSMVCFPALQVNISKAFPDNPATAEVYELASRYNDIQRAWFPLLLVSPVLAALLGIMYIRLLDSEGRVIFWVNFAVLVITLIGGGTYYIVRHFKTQVEEASQDDLLYGALAITLGLLAAVVTYINREGVQRSFKCLEAAGECIGEMGSMIWLPVLESLQKALLLGIFVFGTACLVSLHGFMGSTEYYALVVYSLFMFFWIVEALGALSQFVLGFMSEEWYFSSYSAFSFNMKEVQPRALSRAYAAGITYHMGSFAMGSLLNVLLKPLRTCFRFLTMCSRRYDADPHAGACGGCVNIYDKLAPFSDTAWLEVSLTGKAYVPSAQAAYEIIAPKGYQDGTFQFHGALFELQLVGAGCISGIAGVTVWLITRFIPFYNDPTSSNFISDTALVASTAFFIAAFTVWPFMVSYGHVADALLFCFKTEASSAILGGINDLVGSARERAALCEVPDCLGGNSRKTGGFSALKFAFDKHPPKTSYLFQSLGLQGSSGSGGPFSSPLQSPRGFGGL